MKDFDEADNVLIEMAVDDSRRQVAIKNLTRKRKHFFWCAAFFTVCLSVIGFSEVCGKTQNSGFVAMDAFAAAMTWMGVFNCQSDLRLLKLVEKLKK